ncbi:MAG TPA: serine hydrolase domain-containing protein [Allosphingosinicella sp.]
MDWLRLLAPFLLLLSPTRSPAVAAAVTVQPAPELEGLHRYLVDRRFSGSVLVARGDKILLNRGYGMANYEWNIPADPETKYKLASVTKQFTAAAILLLQERGKLSVNDNICKWIDPCPAAWRPVTLHHLLTHSSGVGSPHNLPDFAKTARLPATPAELAAMSAALPMDFAPGTQWAYSNGGYNLLGIVIERASGKSYAEFLRTEIFEPLGMRNSGYDDGKAVLAKRADGYDFKESKLVRANFEDMSVPYSAGGLYSTVEDLRIWYKALFGKRFLSEASLRAMLGEAGGKVRYPTHEYRGLTLLYGYGLENGPLGRIVLPGFDGKQYFHTGSIEGFRSLATYVPEQDITVIAISNVTGVLPLLLLSQKAVAALTGKAEPTKVAPLTPPAGAAPTPAQPAANAPVR